MVKPKYVYHGSERKLKMLIPKQAKDLGRIRDNMLKGIYASSVKQEAIAMALHSCKGVRESSLQMYKFKGKMKIKNSIIYRGWPKQKYVYLYILSSKTFINRPKGSPQWISLKLVKPLKIGKLSVKKYIHLIRKPTKKERKEWEKLKKNAR